MVVNEEKLVAEIRAWIKEQVLGAGATTAVVGISGGADSALVALLCKGIPEIRTVGVWMPANSSPSSLERARELDLKTGLHTITFDLGAAFSSFVEQAQAAGIAHPENREIPNSATGALRSCLRAPVLDFVGKLTNGIIVGTGNRDEDELTRYFQKRGDGSVDISPIAKLHKSEVYQLLKYLGCPQSIIDAVPTADLWGADAGQEDEKELGVTYAEVEWAIRENDATQVITNDGWGPSLTKFLSYTPRQIEVLQKVAKLEKASRHKASLPPVLDLRFNDDLLK